MNFTEWVQSAYIISVGYSFFWFMYNLDQVKGDETYPLGAARTLYVTESILLSLTPGVNLWQSLKTQLKRKA